MDYLYFSLDKDFKDKIFKRTPFIYMDKDNTIDHLLNIPGAKIRKELYSPTTGYELNTLKVPDKYIDQVEPLMNNLSRALIIKDVNYNKAYEEVIGALFNTFMSAGLIKEENRGSLNPD